MSTVSGTATSNLWKLLKHFFGADEDSEEARAAKASSLANHEECEQDSLVAAQSVEKESLTAQYLPKTPKPKTLKEKRLVSEDTFPNKCSLKEAQLYFPTSQHTMHQTGVPDDLVSEQIKLGGYKGCYPCQNKNCEFVAQTRGMLCSHIRRVHLRITLGCHFCPEKCWWQARYWVENIDKAHPDAHKFEVIPPGSKPIVSSMDADLFVSEETFVLPCPWL